MTGIEEQIGDATNVLLGAPSMGGGLQDVCQRLLSPESLAGATVLWVTFTTPPDRLLADWRETHGRDPAEFGFVVVGDTGIESADVDSARIETVSSPSDLTGIGIAVGEFLSNHDDGIRVCFDSLTALLQYVDVETAYEFLHALTGQLYSADAVSHFHVDPNAHDRRTVDTLLSLFDAAVELEDGEPTVRTRHLLE